MDQHQAFQDRLARLNAGKSALAGHTVPSDVARTPAATRPAARPVKLNDWRENIRFPAQIVGAFVVGMIGVFVARYVRFHMNGGALTGEDADLMMLLDAGMAMAVGFFFSQLFRFQGGVFKSAQAAGVAVMVAGMHNVVFWAPQTFSIVFSPDWVSAVQTETIPNSVLFRGVAFALDPEAALAGEDGAPKAAPSYIVLDSQRG